jgi:hypothetical protein
VTKRPTGIKVETKNVVISYENVEAAVVSFLYATRTIPESWDVLSTDIPLALNEEGFIEFEMEIAKPIKRDFKVVDNNFVGEQDNEKQMTLPLEVFNTINVTDS